MDKIDSTDVGTVDGYDIAAYVTYDEQSTIDDDEGCDNETIDAWRRDEWHYVGLVVTASRAGVELGSSSLWRLEYGILPGIDGWVSPLDRMDHYGDVTDEAIAEAQATLAKLTPDTQALNDIATLMSGRDWSADTLDGIAYIVRATGRTVLDSGEAGQ